MAIITGTSGDDRLRGTLAADTISGLGGDDQIAAKAGDDLLQGGAGLDSLRGELGNDRLFGGADADFLVGGRGNDRLFGGAGSDNMSDAADGPDGNDLFDGGAGIDQIGYALGDVGVTITLGEGGAAGRARQGAEVDTVRGVENVQATLAADTIVGNSLANEISGNGGSDRLEGRGGNDRLYGGFSVEDGDTLVIDGGAGNDFIDGGRGSAARLRGGTGADRIFSNGDTGFEPRDVDTVDLGRDSNRDFLLEFGNVDPAADQEFGFGVDRVTNFRAQDQLRIEVFLNPDDGRFNAKDYLDSNTDGRISDADRDVRLVGRDLVIDFDALFNRESGPPLPGGDQHVVLQHVTSFDADQLV